MYVSTDQRTSRITTGAKIASLASAFKLANDAPFTIFLKKNGSTETCQVLSVTLMGASAPTNYPFAVEEWSPVLLKAVNATTNEASGFDIYWGAGGIETV